MRTVLLALLFSTSFAAIAQDTKPAQRAKPFKVKIGGGYALPAYQSSNATDSKGGFVYLIEPQYEIMRNLDLGVRLEQALVKRAEFLDNVIYYQSKAKSVSSALVTANYTIPIGSSLRAYLGVGTGLYYVDASEQVNQTIRYPLPATTTIGGMGRVGVKFSLVYLEADYNLIGDTNVTNNASRLTLTAKNSYFSVKAGITIGGSH